MEVGWITAPPAQVNGVTFLRNLVNICSSRERVLASILFIKAFIQLKIFVFYNVYLIYIYIYIYKYFSEMKYPGKIYSVLGKNIYSVHILTVQLRLTIYY